MPIKITQDGNIVTLKYEALDYKKLGFNTLQEIASLQRGWDSLVRMRDMHGHFGRAYDSLNYDGAKKTITINFKDRSTVEEFVTYVNKIAEQKVFTDDEGTAITKKISEILQKASDKESANKSKPKKGWFS